jgi:TolB-like protein/Tfp pilus assembly protein PilF
MQEPGGFFAELRRRNVIRMAGLYLVAAWLIVQVSGTVLPMFDAPTWLPRSIVVVLAIGFLPAIVFAWVYEITPEGVKRESDVERHESIMPQTGQRMDRAIIVILALALVVFAVDRFVLSPRREAAHDTALRTELAAQSAQPDKGESTHSIPEIETDPSIAVLPLADLSQAHDQAYFSDGISEELLNLLAKVPKLRVIARTSSFSFKGKNTAIPDIARALNVAALLEGSVRRAGDTVRITVELIRAKDGTQLWSENYNRKFDDIFAIQDEIAAKVVEQLKIKLLGAVPTAKPIDPNAYPLILQAQRQADQQSKASREQAERLFRQALDIAPNETRAWVGLARIYVNQMVLAERPSDEAARLVTDAANRALAIEPDNPVALAQLARVASEHDLDLAAAAHYYQRILDKEPGNLHGINGASSLLRNIGRVEQALPLVEYRIAHDPANATAYYNWGNTLADARHWDAAIQAARTALRLSPQFSTAHGNIGTALLIGKHDAVAALKEFEAEPDEATRLQGLALSLHALGRAKEADVALQSLIDKYASDQQELIATAVYAVHGDADGTFAWLDKAVAANDPAITSVLNEPLFDSLHSDPRWLPFLRKVGYAPEQLAKIEFKVTLPDSGGGARATVP